jgi:hypothetical protein
LSFDWAPTYASETKDGLKSLYSIPQARLQKKQWFPNKKPGWGNVVKRGKSNWKTLQKAGAKEDEDVVFYDDPYYEYVILGTRTATNIADIFEIFRNENAPNPFTDSSTEKVPGVSHYNILGYWNWLSRNAARAKCFYSYARLVAAKILQVEEGCLDMAAKYGTWFLKYHQFLEKK